MLTLCRITKKFSRFPPPLSRHIKYVTFFALSQASRKNILTSSRKMKVSMSKKNYVKAFFQCR